MPESLRQQNQSRKSATAKTAASQSRSPAPPARTRPLLPSHGIANQVMQNSLRNTMIQAKLRVSTPGDQYEQEADRVADQVMRTPDTEVMEVRQGETDASGLGIQRVCGECEDELHRQPMQDDEEVQAKEVSGETPQVSPDVHGQIEAMRGGGAALPDSARQFFEPRFSQDFSDVRIHTSSAAHESARALNARAYTRGRDIFFGGGEYTPHTSGGRRLLAHELVHTIQQGNQSNSRLQPASATQSVVQRQNIDASCDTTLHPSITRAWSEAIRLTQETIDRLNTLVDLAREPGGPAAIAPSWTEILRKVFGDIGGMEGGQVHFFTPLIRNFERILAGFTSRTVRCAAATDPRCRGAFRAAFVDQSVRNAMFLCTGFESRDPVVLAETLIHEMAHSVLGATHEGFSAEENADSAPGMFFGCEAPGLGLPYEVARRNAYAYEILVSCWVGSHPTSTVSVAPRAMAPSPRPQVETRSNTLGAVALFTPPGSFGAEARYSRVLLGRGSRFQFLTGASVSYLSQGNEVGLGAGLSLRYSWPRIYVRGGVQLSGEAALSPPATTPGSPNPVLRLDVAPDFEAGVRIGVVRIGAGYQILIPVSTNASTADLGHRINLGISVDL